MDDDCLPVIPITPNGYLEEYLEYHVKRKILEDAMLSDDTVNKQYIYSSYMQQETDLHAKQKLILLKLIWLRYLKQWVTIGFRMHKYDVYLGALKTNYIQSGAVTGFGTMQNPNPYRF